MKKIIHSIKLLAIISSMFAYTNIQSGKSKNQQNTSETPHALKPKRTVYRYPKSSALVHLCNLCSKSFHYEAELVAHMAEEHTSDDMATRQRSERTERQRKRGTARGHQEYDDDLMLAIQQSLQDQEDQEELEEQEEQASSILASLKTRQPMR